MLERERERERERGGGIPQKRRVSHSSVHLLHSHTVPLSHSSTLTLLHSHTYYSSATLYTIDEILRPVPPLFPMLHFKF